MTMDQEQRELLYKQVLETWGMKAQVMMLFEETAELQKEVCKHFNRGEQNVENVEEEVADVEIMIAQLKTMLDISKERVEAIKERKLQRLKMRLEEWKENQQNQ